MHRGPCNHKKPIPPSGGLRTPSESLNRAMGFKVVILHYVSIDCLSQRSIRNSRKLQASGSDNYNWILQGP